MMTSGERTIRTEVINST